MLKNYLKIAWRNLKKNRASSMINIGGLAVGMAVALLIGLWINDELTFDEGIENHARIAQAWQHQTSNGVVYTLKSIPHPLGNELRSSYGQNFKYIVMASWQGNHILTAGDKHLSKNGGYMEPQATDMLSLDMIKGTRNGLKDPHSILLSESAAKAFFGDKDPMGQTIRIDNNFPVQVSGVYKDLPANSEFGQTHFIAPWSLYVSSEPWIKSAEQQWGNNSFQCFVQIADNTDFATVNKQIRDAKLKRQPPEDQKYKAKIFLHPMKDWHLRSNWDDNGNQAGGAIQFVWLFSIVGAFVLLLACINFMNLSTARSEKRAREVGIRKAVGSMRRQLIGQFYSESVLVVVFAYAVSLVFTRIVLNWFNEVSLKQMTMPWSNPYFWLASLAFIIITSLLAGSYPALYLSSFNPVKVLKGTFKTGRLAAIPRKVLVVVQFTISLALIIGTMILYSQIQHTKNRPIGYNRDGLVMVEMRSPEFYGKYDVLKHELTKAGAITEIAESSSPLTDVWSNNSGYSWPGKDPNLDADFAAIWVTHDFGKTVQWEFTKGRDFSRDFKSDSLSVVLNEAAVKFMNIKDPIGTTIENDGEKLKVIGVVKDMLMQSPYAPVKQTMYFLSYERVNWINMKLNPAKSAAASIAIIESVFRKHIPDAPFEYKFTDQEFAAKFALEERIGTLSTVFAGLAIFISCLGLFGLSSFVAEQRTKEIGVRKVLGASVFNLWQLLSTEFVLLVAASFLIAVPLTYFFMRSWLLNYPYRTGIYWWLFATAGLGAFVITILTISFQSIRAALANPVKSLRTE